MGPAAAAAAPPPAPVERDRWQDLRTALAGCGSLGLLERATCEQGARIAHCDRYWGLVPQCPVGRTDYGN
jgi:hypothetical protein